jgi:hypothetical protein
MVGGEPALFIQRLRVTTLTLSSYAASPRVSKSKSRSIGRIPEGCCCTVTWVIGSRITAWMIINRQEVKLMVPCLAGKTERILRI